nr:hypothetical protein [uncultured Halomonas sp.]
MANASPVRGASRALIRVIHYAVDHGWNVEHTRGGHVRFIKPGCSPVITGFSLSNRPDALDRRH